MRVAVKLIIHADPYLFNSFLGRQFRILETRLFIEFSDHTCQSNRHINQESEMHRERTRYNIAININLCKVATKCAFVILSF